MLCYSLYLELVESTCCLAVCIYTIWSLRSSHAVLQSVFGVSGVHMLSGSLYLHYLELEELTCCATVCIWS